MSSNYDGINTLSRVATAAYTRETAKALEEANKINKERNRIMSLEATRARENDRKLQEIELQTQRDAKKAADEQTRIIEAEQSRQTKLVQLEHERAELARKKAEDHRQNEIRKSNAKSILFSIHNDITKTLADSNCSPLDKYIHICGAITILKKDKIDQGITDDFSEKEKIQKMIDDINNNHKSVRDSFTKQDESDHDELIKILETDEEHKIYFIEKEIRELKKMTSVDIENLQKKLDEQNIEIEMMNREINGKNHSIERLQKELAKLNDDSFLLSLRQNIYNIKNDTFFKDLKNYQESGDITALMESIIYSKIITINHET